MPAKGKLLIVTSNRRKSLRKLRIEIEGFLKSDEQFGKVWIHVHHLGQIRTDVQVDELAWFPATLLGISPSTVEYVSRQKAEAWPPDYVVAYGEEVWGCGLVRGLKNRNILVHRLSAKEGTRAFDSSKHWQDVQGHSALIANTTPLELECALNVLEKYAAILEQSCAGLDDLLGDEELPILQQNRQALALAQSRAARCRAALALKQRERLRIVDHALSGMDTKSG